MVRVLQIKCHAQVSGVTTTVINTGVIATGLYVISYETGIQNASVRTFTSFETCVCLAYWGTVGSA